MFGDFSILGETSLKKSVFIIIPIQLYNFFPILFDSWTNDLDMFCEAV